MTSIPVLMTLFGLVYMCRVINCNLKEKFCKCCVDLEKKDDNLDYGTYYYSDGDRRLDVMEVNMATNYNSSLILIKGKVQKKKEKKTNKC